MSQKAPTFAPMVAPIEAHAQHLVDANDVEQGWFYRGVAAGLSGFTSASEEIASEARDPKYGRYFRAGLDGTASAVNTFNFYTN